MTQMKSRTIVAAVALSLGGSLVGGVSSSQADTTYPLRVSSGANASLSQGKSVDELASHLRRVNADVLLDANGQYDYDAAEATFGTTFADRFQAEWTANFAGPQRASDVAGRAALTKDSYAACLLKGVGLGGLGGVSAAIVDKLKDKKWSDAARLITKEAAKRGVKIGVKGGVAGLAAALGAFAVWCATPWS